MVELRKCSGTCGKTLELTKENFKWRNDTKKFRKQCKKCSGKGVPSNIIIKNNIIYKVCSGTCNLLKEENDINFLWREYTNKFNGQCRICTAAIKKEYNEINKEEINKKRNDNYKNKKDEKNLKRRVRYNTDEEYREAILIKALEYAKNEETKIKNNAKNRKKRKLEPEFRLRQYVSNAVNDFLKDINKDKNGISILKKLPYTMKELTDHIEYHFSLPGNEWMNWNNQGKYTKNTWRQKDKSTWTWQLDHIIPHSIFKYDSLEHPDFIKCWMLSNLRPYSAKQNQLDGATKIRHTSI